MVEYEYRCRECKESRTLSQVQKNLWDAVGVPMYCRVCPGPMFRVWGANVTTVSVPGFYANVAKAPD